MAKKPLGYLAGSLILGTVIGAVLGVLASPMVRKTPGLQKRVQVSRLRRTLSDWRGSLPGQGRRAFQRIKGRLGRSLGKHGVESSDNTGYER